MIGADPYGFGPLDLLERLKKLWEGGKCAKAANAVRQAADKCDRKCPKNAELEKQAEFIDRYGTNVSYAQALTACVWQHAGGLRRSSHLRVRLNLLTEPVVK